MLSVWPSISHASKTPSYRQTCSGKDESCCRGEYATNCTKRASGVGSTRAATVAKATPRQPQPSRDQRVTQWISYCTSTWGRRRNSSYVHVWGRCTSPLTVRRHCCKSRASGIGARSPTTGNLRVACCRGGREEVCSIETSLPYPFCPLCRD